MYSFNVLLQSQQQSESNTFPLQTFCLNVDGYKNQPPIGLGYYPVLEGKQFPEGRQILGKDGDLARVLADVNEHSAFLLWPVASVRVGQFPGNRDTDYFWMLPIDRLLTRFK